MPDLDIPAWFEVVSLVVLTAVLAGDLLLILRRPRVPSTRESVLWVVFYVTAALVFAVLLLAVTGDGDAAGQFLTGWLTEYSLSVDNLFVFVLLMTRFAVPRRDQQEVLMVGIVIALVLRGLAILVGAALIERVGWIFYLFGAFLVYTAVRQALSSTDEVDDQREPGVVRVLRRVMPISDAYDGARLRTTVDGRRMWTPMLLVFVAIGFTDLLFALDSIPAVFGVTKSAFIVFSANLFALMGLRQLYFLLGGLLDRLRYLHYGIAFVLAFIGVKLVLQALHENSVPFVNGGQPVEWAPDIPTLVSLAVIVVAMTTATVASLVAARHRPSV